ncbi:MAG TPA: Gfo/Idh/MocA family oxidoreductase [Anaerolineaceae bacterium]|nr:Gfo/Idh/MocA family oxidoreductase [Anaerolineaceae bacterium]
MNDSQLTRVGVIGTGGMGSRHVVNLHRYVGGATVTTVYDLDQGKAAQAADQAGGASIADDPIQLIQSPNVDAVLIASPDDTHARMTLACLEAGKPVLCEKPLATTVDDAVEVLDAEIGCGRRLVSVGFMRRFDPQHLAVKQAALSDEIGRPLLFKGVHRNASVAFGISGATVLTNSAGHDFDSARWLLGEEVQEVYVRGLRSRPELHPDTRDLLVIEMVLSNNCMAVAEVYVNDSYGYEVSAELVCQSGAAVTMQPDLALVRAGGHRGHRVPSDWLSRFQDAYVAELLDWIGSIQSEQPFHGASTWDGYAAMMVTSACIQSLGSGAVVPVLLPEKPDFYR